MWSGGKEKNDMIREVIQWYYSTNIFTLYCINNIVVSYLSEFK